MAIGAAYSAGALALGAFLVVGFALHNTTEGLAIVAPLARERVSVARLALLGLLAGGPAVLGAWIGAAAYNPSAAAFLFGFGAGAIVQVIVTLAPTLRDESGRTAASGGRDGHPCRHGFDVRDRPPRLGVMGTRPSEAIEDYAKAIYSLSRQGDGTAGTNALAERLGVTPASVSAMVKKLDERGLVRHVRYKGVALTPAGERVALEVMRHHRLLETYLVEHLGVPWDRVHEEAEALEHVLVASTWRRASPPSSATRPTTRTATRSRRRPWSSTSPRPSASPTSRPGDRGVFVRVSDSDPAMLRYLDERGVALGDRAGGAGAPAVRRAVDGALRGRVARAGRDVGAGDAGRAVRVGRPRASRGVPAVTASGSSARLSSRA